MDNSHLFLLLWAGLACWVLGQIWLVQIVIYPLFGLVGEADYVHYHRFYTRRIRLPVILPGFACFLLPIALIFYAPPSVPAALLWTNLAAGIVGLLVTVLLEIPRHGRLEKAGKNATTIAELIRYNWPRTLSISVQAVVAILMLRTLSRRSD